MTYMEPDAVVTQYDGLCHKVASRLEHTTTHWHEFDDLLQEAYIALLDANERYDPSRGEFDSYAYCRVYFSVLDVIRKTGFVKRSSKEERKFYSPYSLDWMKEQVEGRDRKRSEAPFRDYRAEEDFEEVLDRIADVQAVEGFLRFYAEHHSGETANTANVVLAMAAHSHYRTSHELSEHTCVTESRVCQIFRDARIDGQKFRDLLDA